MPQRRHPKNLSAFFYAYGKKCGTRACAIFLISLIFIFIFSYPIVSRAIPSNDPDDVEGRFWQYSPHLQPENISSFDSTPELIIQQIRIVNDRYSVNADLLLQTQMLQEALMSRTILVDGESVSLASICLLRHNQCIVHSPLDYWQKPEFFDPTRGWKMHINTRQISKSSGLLMHPRSVFGNVTLDKDGQFISADSVILTFLLQETPFLSTARVWDALWQNVTTELRIHPLTREQQDDDHTTSNTIHSWQTQVDVSTNLVHYNFKPISFRLNLKAYLYMGGYLAVCFFVSTLFGNPHLVRSQLARGFATIFAMIACYTTTRGVLEYLNIQLLLVPWYLQIVVPIVSTLENMLLLANAVLSAGCDMHVKEKIGRGIESVGIPITLTLIAEWLILAIGTSMHIPRINEFCLFARTSLLVGYLIDMTFGLSFLAINAKYFELADLDDRQTTKRLRELAKSDIDADVAPDFCPIQEPQDDSTPKTCAECKHFKTHRTYNALMLCLIILALTFIRPTAPSNMAAQEISYTEMHAVSTRFWDTVNPLHQKITLQISPPHLVAYAPTSSEGRKLLEPFEKYYQSKVSTEQRPTSAHQPRQMSRFRKFLLSSIVRAVSLLAHINVPSVLLTLVLILIIMWRVPSLQQKWLQPFHEKLLENIQQLYLILLRLLSRSFTDYDQNGVHPGAISVQERFDHQQLEHNIGNVVVKTLSGRHVADIRRLAVNAKYSTVVSCGQDGRIIMWDADKGDWMARLDRVTELWGEVTETDLNPIYWNVQDRKEDSNKSKGRAGCRQLRSARCIKIDAGNKWIASGFDDGTVRVWRISSGTLVREMGIEVSDLETSNEGSTVICRKQHRRGQEQHNDKRTVDRVIALQFIGAITEHGQSSEAKGPARQHQMKDGYYDPTSQHYIVSVHKSGTIREWDILSGQCIQAFPSGHFRDVAILQVAECKNRGQKLAVSWIFTASKDGVIKCWERHLIETDIREPEAAVTTWTCIYTIDGHGGHAITALATEVPVGGMGVLVSGSSNGVVKVWNFETGDAICTLSAGGVKRRNPEVHMGGPLLKFSKFSPKYDHNGARIGDSEPAVHSVYELPTANSGDHHGPVTQVVVTRYCEVDNGPGLCRGCDTCFGNGFGIASCALDEAVHVWRLERADGKHEGTCTLCIKNYHQKRYTRTRPQASPATDDQQDPKGQRLRAGTLSGSRRTYGAASPSVVPNAALADDSTAVDGAQVMEQPIGENTIVLEPVFLGKIKQLAGRGLVFCNNMVLGGVRKKPTRGSSASASSGNDWEAWFASLKYYANKNYIGNEIPVETFDLEPPSPQKNAFETNTSTETSMLGVINRFTWGGSKTPNKSRMTDGEKSDDEYELVYDEASELLPFSMVRHVVSLDGSGIACDFGNFIKLIYLRDPAPKLHPLTLDARTATSEFSRTSNCTNKKCCGGSNKKRSGSCCSNTTRKRTEQHALGEARRTACQTGGDCLSNTSCSRSPASSNQPSTAWKW
ncbi:hypothetical protein BX666DRAFT_1880608 [Dichotomocladium elegans]|nr:hypothetical protein BX666DRAFT_1880608 [Dichotomocladium elegans]